MKSKVFVVSLVIQHNVWLPYPVRWHPDKLDTSVIFWIPFQFVIIPDLENHITEI